MNQHCLFQPPTDSEHRNNYWPVWWSSWPPTCSTSTSNMISNPQSWGSASKRAKEADIYARKPQVQFAEAHARAAAAEKLRDYHRLSPKGSWRSPRPTVEERLPHHQTQAKDVGHTRARARDSKRNPHLPSRAKKIGPWSTTRTTAYYWWSLSIEFDHQIKSKTGEINNLLTHIPSLMT
jgi:hypothetical protein